MVRPRWAGLHRLITLEQKLELAAGLRFEPHPAQREILASAARFRVVCCGRRFGKSLLSSFESLAVALLGGWVCVVGPTYKNATIVFREALRMALNSEYRALITRVVRSPGDQVIEFASGGKVTVRSSENPSSLLGEGWDLIVFDEAAEETDEGIFTEHLRPALLDRDGGCLFLSTPEGDDWFKAYWDRGQSAEPRWANWESWQFPSHANPHVSARVLEEDRREATASTWAQEYLAQFLDSVGAVFRGSHHVATAPFGDEVPGQFAIGYDVAKYQDYSVVTVMDTEGRVRYMERLPQGLDYDVQAEMVAAISARWGGAPVLIDSTGVGDPVREILARAINWSYVEGYVFTTISKTHLVNQFAVAIERGEVRLLAPAMEPGGSEIGSVALAELGSYRYSKSPSGTIKMGAPEGKHDDCVMSLCLAYEMLRRGVGGAAPQPLLVTPASRPSMSARYGRPK